MRSRVQRAGACCLISSRILIVHPLAVAVSQSLRRQYRTLPTTHITHYVEYFHVVSQVHPRGRVS